MISGDRSVLQGRKGAFFAMMEEFHRHWGRVDVICPRVEVPGSIFQTTFGSVFFHPNPRGLWCQPQWIVKKGKELVAAHRHAVMSVHEYPPFYNGLGAEWLHRRTGVTYVIEVHHIVGHPKASSVTELLGRWLSHLFLVNDTYGAAAVRCVSRGTAETLIRWGANADDVFIVPSFYLNQTHLTPDSSIRKEYDIVCCGRLVANKNFGGAIAAVAAIPGATLLIIGDGPERRRLERGVRTFGIEGRVAFAGWLPDRAAVSRAIQSARVFVCNSASEGGPRVALEAMALGMPVVTTRVGVMPEVIRDGENGLMTTGTPCDLAQKIGKLLDYPSLRDNLGSEARKILDRFEKKQLIREYAAFLQRFAHPSP